MRISRPLFNAHAEGGGGVSKEGCESSIMVAASLTGALFNRKKQLRMDILQFLKEAASQGVGVTILVADCSANDEMSRMIEHVKRVVKEISITNMPTEIEDPADAFGFIIRSKIARSGKHFDLIIDDDLLPYSGVEFQYSCDPEDVYFKWMIQRYLEEQGQDLGKLIQNYFGPDTDGWAQDIGVEHS